MEDLDSQSNKEEGLAAVHAEEDSGNSTPVDYWYPISCVISLVKV